MHERILVPLDGSAVGEAALPSVEKLVTKLTPKVEVEVILLQVLTSLTHYVIAGEASVKVPYTDREVERIKRRSRTYLSKIGDELKKRGVTVKTKVTTGRAAEEIIRVAEETRSDMIAMSTHGRSGLSRLTFGSITDKVLRTGTIPVLVVRAPKDTGNT